MMYVILFIITLIGENIGQIIYENMSEDKCNDAMQTCYKEFYKRELFLENQVNKLTKEVKSIKGWTTFMNSEYWLGRDEVTWDKAKLNCMAEDGKLVEIESYAEDNFVRALAMELTKTVWLGGTDVGTEGRWIWGSDRSPFTYSAWNRAKGQPNNYNNQDCLGLYRPYNLTWCDEKCETRYQYICEKEIAQDS
nr:perlucin-like protein [Crassostrea gigas]